MPSAVDSATPLHPWRRAALYGLTLAAVFLAGLLFNLIRSGPPLLTWDDVSRAMWAVFWAKRPFFFPSDLVWLPAPMWIDGIAVWVGGNGWEPILAVNFVSGIVIVLMVALFAHEAGIDHPLAAGFLAALSPMVVLLSASRMSEPKAWAFEMLGLYLWQRFAASRQTAAYAAAFLPLGLAAFSRYEFWPMPLMFLGHGLYARLRHGKPPLWAVAIPALPLAAGLALLLYLNWTRFGLPIYGGSQWVREANVTVPPLSLMLDRLVAFASAWWPYFAFNLPLAVAGCIAVAARSKLKAESWLPCLSGLLAGLLGLALGPLSGLPVTFAARVVGGGLLALLPFSAAALWRLPPRVTAPLALTLGAAWLMATPPPPDNTHQVAAATQVALRWRQAAAVAVQEPGPYRVIESAVRTVLPLNVPAADVWAGPPYPGWIPSGFPFGREVLVIYRPGAPLGLDKANSLSLLQTPDFAFSLVCPPAPSYNVPMEVRGVPQRVQPGHAFDLQVSVTNTMNFPWRLEGPCPVNGAWQWSTPSKEGERTRFRLPQEVWPGQRATWQVRVKAPDEPGTYRLSFTLVQERSVWFDTRPGFRPPLFYVEVR